MLGRFLHTVLEAHKRQLRLIGGLCDISAIRRQIEQRSTKAVSMFVLYVST
jgi:hypothetical protein